MIKTENIREFRQLCSDLHIGNDWSKVEDAKIIWEAAVEWTSKKEKIAAEFIQRLECPHEKWHKYAEKEVERRVAAGEDIKMGEM